MSSDWIVDEEHVAKLELKLKQLTNREVSNKEVLRQLEEVKNFQLSSDNTELCFEDNFVDDKVVVNSWIKNKAFPQNCAIVSSELLKLPDHDSLKHDEQ
uniref:Ovule protein n=1 Tax=Parastrongyloides trichosuri TaxID=131310 RepID=A0A0N4ZP49_PARTI